MHAGHLQALKRRHEQIEFHLHEEGKSPSCDEALLDRLKREKLRVKEEIERLKKAH